MKINVLCTIALGLSAAAYASPSENAGLETQSAEPGLFDSFAVYSKRSVY
jgi:hypothetical protein